MTASPTPRQGTLSQQRISDVLRDLAATEITGRLTVAGSGLSAHVCLRDGLVVDASAPGARARLGDRLVGARVITDAQLQRVLAVQRVLARPKRIGELLIAQQLVDYDTLREVVREQMIDSLAVAVGWRSGSWRFETDAACDEDIPLNSSVENAVMDAARRLDEWSAIHAEVGSLDAVVDFVPGGAANLALTPDEWSMLTRIDGRRSIAELAAATGYGAFEAARIVFGLLTAGVVAVIHVDVAAQTATTAEPPATGTTAAANTVEPRAEVALVLNVDPTRFPSESVDFGAHHGAWGDDLGDGASPDAPDEGASGDADDLPDLDAVALPRRIPGASLHEAFLEEAPGVGAAAVPPPPEEHTEATADDPDDDQPAAASEDGASAVPGGVEDAGDDEATPADGAPAIATANGLTAEVGDDTAAQPDADPTPPPDAEPAGQPTTKSPVAGMGADAAPSLQDPATRRALSSLFAELVGEQREAGEARRTEALTGRTQPAPQPDGARPAAGRTEPATDRPGAVAPHGAAVAAGHDAGHELTTTDGEGTADRARPADARADADADAPEWSTEAASEVEAGLPRPPAIDSSWQVDRRQAGENRSSGRLRRALGLGRRG